MNGDGFHSHGGVTYMDGACPICDMIASGLAVYIDEKDGNEED